MASRVLRATIKKGAMDKLNKALVERVAASPSEATDIAVSDNKSTSYMQRANVGRNPSNVITSRNPDKIGLYKQWDHSELTGGEAASHTQITWDPA